MVDRQARDARAEILGIADALDCFWNAALGAAQESQDATAHAVAGALAEGFSAIARRLRETDALAEQAAALHDAAHAGVGVLQDGKHVPLSDFYERPAADGEAVVHAAQEMVDYLYGNGKGWIGYANITGRIAILGGKLRDALRVNARSIPAPSCDAVLREACNRILPYLRWTIGPESPGHHPTMPSAVGAFAEALSASGSPGDVGQNSSDGEQESDEARRGTAALLSPADADPTSGKPTGAPARNRDRLALSDGEYVVRKGGYFYREAVAWRYRNDLGEVVSEWIDGPPPEFVRDDSTLAGMKIDVAYAASAKPVSVETIARVMVEADDEEDASRKLHALIYGANDGR